MNRLFTRNTVKAAMLLMALLPGNRVTIYAQWQPAGATTGSVYYNNGNVGIGTENPGTKLDIAGGIIRINNAGETDIHYLLDGKQWEVGTNNYGNGEGNNHFYIYDNDYRFTVQRNTGNVGIGTRTPQYRLDVIGGSLRTDNMFICDSYNGAQIRINSRGTYYGKIGNPVAQVWSLGYGNTGTDISPVLSWTATNNVLIGKISQTNTEYKLDVAGKIRATEIVVNTTGADFVFEPSYKLRSLSELETFIKVNKRLPDIAPAKEMQENGVSAGEMQAKLLQKVEETTLYLIEQSKQIDLLRAENIEKTQQLAIQQQLLTELKKEIEQLKQNQK